MRKFLVVLLISLVVVSAFAVREFVGAWPYPAPNVAHFNIFTTNAVSFGRIYNELIRLPLAFYIWAEGKYIPILATDWKFEPPDNPKKFIVHLRKGVKWSDGSEVTSKDVWASYMIGYIRGWSDWKYIEKVETPDKYTVVFHLKKPTLLVERLILRNSNIADYKTYGEYAERIAKLLEEGKDKSSDEMKKLIVEFNDFRPKEMLANGPFMPDMNNYTEAEAHLIRNPYYYDKETVKFDRIRLINGETAVITPLILAKQIDYATHAFPPATEKQFIAEGIRIIRAPLGSGPALVFNHSVYPFNLKEFRQALAYAIDRKQCGFVSMGNSGKGVVYMAGMSDNLVPVWMEKDAISKLNRYEYNPKKAEEILLKLGFKKGKDGIWRDDKGNKLEFELIAPSEWTDWFAAAENVASQLNDFGMKITVRGITWTQVLPTIREGKFQLAIQLWGSGNPHPYYALYNDFIRMNIEKYRGGIGTNLGMNFPLENVKTDRFGEVNVYDELINSVVGTDRNEHVKRITKLALVFNETLPLIPLWERYGNNPALDGVRVTGWLPEGDPIYKNNVYLDNFVTYMILKGILKPVE
ncbi:MAG: ABC transporter substrate-binding protein [Thermotoga sp.]|nr:MAG: ABC transporter substrate-binding protein [Thermotoga sp.]HDM70900.1 ABC transporter substrate-binding protein [Thermotogales bacterium]